MRFFKSTAVSHKSKASQQQDCGRTKLTTTKTTPTPNVIVCLFLLLACLVPSKCFAARRPPAASCVQQSSVLQPPTFASRLGAELELGGAVKALLASAARTSIQLWPLQASSQQQTPSQQQQAQPIAFRSICGGWRNSVPSADAAGAVPPAAFWVLDAKRGALVAKFTYHRSEFPPKLLDARDARLTSPKFAPPPLIIANETSKYFRGCKFSFSTYATIASLIELSLIIVPQNTNSSINNKSAPLIFVPLLKLREPKQVQSKLFAQTSLSSSSSSIGQQQQQQRRAGWQAHSVSLPAELALLGTPYALDLSASPTLVDSQAAYKPTVDVLNGVAIANLSLSNECFGIGVSEFELSFSKQNTSAAQQLDARLLRKLVESTGAGGASQHQALAPGAGDGDTGVALRELQEAATADDYGSDFKAALRPPPLAVWSVIGALVLALVALASFLALNLLAQKRRKQKQLELAAANPFATNGRPLDLQPLERMMEQLELLENPNYVSASSRSLPASLGAEIEAQLAKFRLDRSRLVLTESLGKGAFGEVFSGYLNSDDEGDIANNNNGVDRKQLAIKTLSDERMTAEDFIMEAINMSLVQHRNIVALIGVCLDFRPLYIVMELLEGGNVKNFLISKRQKTTSSAHVTQQSPVDLICIGDLLVFALDIARGCDYLQRRSFIHRDLAARNCLLTSATRCKTPTAPTPNCMRTAPKSTSKVAAEDQAALDCVFGAVDDDALPSPLLFADGNCDEDNKKEELSTLARQKRHTNLDKVFLQGFLNSGMVAKLADFGMTRDVYSTNYYRISQREIPVRWMPPECLDGVATTESDVWSFGVLLWELFSMGQMPYQHLMDNRQVIELIKSRRHCRSAPQTPKPPQDGSNIMQQVNLVDGQSATATSTAIPTINATTTATAQTTAATFLLNATNGQTTSTSNLINATDDLSCDASSYSYSPLVSTPTSLQAHPAPRQRHQHQTQMHQEPIEPPLPAPDVETPSQLYELMCDCWASDPSNRPQFCDVAHRLVRLLRNSQVLAAPLPSFYCDK